MNKSDKFEITATYMMVPMCVMAMTMVFFFAYQATQVMKEKDNLLNTDLQLAQSFDDSQKVNAQFGGLVLGTQKLAHDGAKTAQDLVKRLIEIGILPDPSKIPEKAPVPAAEQPNEGPIKP